MFQKIHWIVIVTFTAVVFFMMGCIFSYLGSSTSVGGNTYQSGWDAAKQRLSDSGMFPSSGMNIEIKSLTGEITEINGDKITVKIRPLEPLADASLDIRTVVVDSATKMFALQPKDQKEFLAEMDAYTQKIKANTAQMATTTPITMPDGFNRTTISMSDLKVGQTINVLSETNIKDVKEFNASEISYYQTVNLAAPMILATTTAPTTTPLK